MPGSRFAVYIIASNLLCMSQAYAEDNVVAKISTADPIEKRIKKLIAKFNKTLRPLKGGTFEMGDWGSKSGLLYDMDSFSKPLHKVTLDGFSIMAYKVTYDDFDTFTDATANERIAMDNIYIKERAPRQPAGVSWYGAKAYCNWLGKLTSSSIDLPTEAQWEYAARSGGKRLLFATDNGKLDRPRNYPIEWENGRPVVPEVGKHPPNPAGIYGMTEDTQEWVQDWFDESYYKNSRKKNPMGPENGIKKVQRGSVGGKAELSAMVFMRTSALPQTLRPTYPDGITAEEKMVPFSGYSSHPSDNFRCVQNN